MSEVPLYGATHGSASEGRGKTLMRCKDFRTCSTPSSSAFAGAPIFLENATVHGRAWYKLLDAPALTLNVCFEVRSRCRKGWSGA